MVRVLQWNARSIRANQLELCNHLTTNAYDVIAIQETWLSDSKTFTLSGYSTLRADRQGSSGGGLALCFPRHFRIQQISSPVCAFGEILVAQILAPFNVRVINVYRPPNQDSAFPGPILTALCSGPTLIVGDFNCHHPLWGSPSADPLGEALAAWADESNFTILNDGSATRFGPQGPSHLDLTLVSSHLLPPLHWHPLPSSWGSDHFPLDVLTTDPPGSSPVRPPSTQISHTNWDDFRARLKDYGWTAQSLSISSSQECSRLLFELSQAAALSSFSRPLTRHVPTPWWTLHCTAAVKARNHALNRARRTLQDEHWRRFKVLQARCRKTLRSAKRAFWQKFCESLSIKDNPRLLYNTIKRLKGIRHNPGTQALEVDGITITDPSSKAKAFAHHFISGSNFHQFTPQIPNDNLTWMHQGLSPLNEDISISEVHQALAGSRQSAPGLDGITYKHLKQLPDNNIETIVKILNFSWQNGYIPPIWKTGLVVPILKPGKPPPQLSSYRPISLTSVLVKLLERVINNRLKWFLERHRILPHSHCGFRQHRSIMNHLVDIEHCVSTALKKRHVFMLTLLDLKSAYDSVPPNALLGKISALGIQGRILRWLAEFLTNRLLRVRTDSITSEVFQIQRGLPQGSVLSPTLFNIYTHDIPQDLLHQSQLGVYADDIALWTSSSNATAARTRIQNHLDRLSRWAATWGLQFEPAKSEALLISRRHLPHPQPLILNDTAIQWKNQVRYLGAIIDSKLSWVPHVHQILRKTNAATNALRCVTSLNMGTKRGTMLHIFRCFVRPHLDFSALFVPTQIHAVQLLQKAQNQALRICLGALRSTAVPALHWEAQEHLVVHRWQYLTTLWGYKQLHYFPHLPLLDIWRQRDSFCYYRTYLKSTSFPSRFAGLVNDFSLPPPAPVSQFPREAPPWLLSLPRILLPPDTGLSKTLALPQIHLYVQEILEEHADFNVVAADGAVSSSLAGMGIASDSLNLRLAYPLPEGTSIFTAEALAIVEALRRACRPPFKTLILTDSLSVLSALAGPGRQASPDTLAILQETHRHHQHSGRVVLCWIPGHRAIPLHEEADSLAKSASRTAGSQGRLPWRPSDCARLCRSLLNHSTFSFYRVTLDQRPHLRTATTQWPSHLFSSRLAETAVTRLRLGHHRLQASLFRFRLTSSDLCPSCSHPEDDHHYLIDCQALAELRRRTLTQTCLSLDIPLTLHSILTLGHQQGHYKPEVVTAIETFILASPRRP